MTSSKSIAQVTSDGTLDTQVEQNGNSAEIRGGETRGSNLFHSFQEFSVPTNNEAFFDNASDISNIFSRVTGGNISNIDGAIRANGSASLFLINPAGIIFGEGASLNIGGSFYGSTASSISFENGKFSAADLENPPLLTVNAPIGLDFRNEPGDIVNRSIITDDTGEIFLGLSVPANETLALLGGNVLIEGGILTTEGGRIELGSVGENSTVSLTPIEQGFDLSYEDVESFQDIALFAEAFITTSGASTADIDIQGQDISVLENSQVGINPNFEGQAGNININATKSLTLDADGSTEVLFSRLSGDATLEKNSINIDTLQLTISGGAQIGGTNDFGAIEGVDININASEITLENSLLTEGFPAIGSQVFEDGTGDGGNITITTEKLTLSDGAQINTSTFGSGNGGNLIINADESIELNGSISDLENNQPSALSAGVGIPLFPISNAGNGGEIRIQTPRLVVSDGAQIETIAQNDGNGGNLIINADESIELIGTSPNAELGGEGRSGIFVNAEPSYEEFILDFDTEEITFTGEIISTTAKGGNLTLNTGTLIFEKGALISADTFSLGNGGNANINVNQLILRDGGRISAGSLLGIEERLDEERGTGGDLEITATESIEITGIGDINSEPVNSSIFTLAESNDNAGNTTLTTNQLNISNGGDINASAEDLGAAGSIKITGDEINLDNGEISASTNAGEGGDLTLEIADNLTLKNNSLISAAAMNDAGGGNINIDSQFIVAFPSGNNDITANAFDGNGGNISIATEGIFGIKERPNNNPLTNDITASSNAGISGNISITTPDLNPIQGATELSRNVIEPRETTQQACQANRETESKNGLTVAGKGGILPDPASPLNSLNATIDGSNIPTADIPEPIETSLGKIQPARGIKVTESGKVILTAYRTNNSGDRVPNQRNCS